MAATIPFSAALFHRGLGNPKIRSRCLFGPATELRGVSKRAFSLRDDSFLPSDIARDFQFFLNGKNMKAIGEIWSDDCLVEDFSFSKPLRGKQVYNRLSNSLHLSLSRSALFCNADVLVSYCLYSVFYDVDGFDSRSLNCTL